MAENSVTCIRVRCDQTKRVQTKHDQTRYHRAVRNLSMSIGLALLAVMFLLQAGAVMAGTVISGTNIVIAPDAEVVYIVALSGAAEVPGPGDDDGAGMIQVTVDATAGEVCYSLSFSNISAPSAGHIHTGAADGSGGVLIGLFADAADAAEGCATGVPAADITALLDNPSGHYVNIHNADFPAGAIRGQLGSPATVLNAKLTGEAEFPGPGDTDGSGTAMIMVDAATGILCYDIVFDQIDAPSAGHIHSGAAGALGGVLIGLFSDAADANSGCVTEADAANISTMLASPANHYVNIHNATFPAGAIRGQLAADTAAVELATVTVAHFAPFASTIDNTAVTVRINGTDVITDFKYNTVITDIVFPAGTYTIEVLPAGTSTVAISTTVTLSNEVDYTVAAIGDVANQPLELLALVDDNSPSATSTNAKIRIAHMAPFADTLLGTQVNICTDAGQAIQSNVPYKVHTDPYAELPAGDYDLKIATSADGCSGAAALDLPPITLAGGGVYDVFAIGNITNQPLNIATSTGLVVAAAPASLELSAEPTVRMGDTRFLPLMPME